MLPSSSHTGGLSSDELPWMSNSVGVKVVSNESKINVAKTGTAFLLLSHASLDDHLLPMMMAPTKARMYRGNRSSSQVLAYLYI